MLTLLATIAGAVLGAIKDLWITSINAKHEEQKALLAKAGVMIKDRERAGNKQFQFARRFIAIAATTSFFIMPWLYTFMYGIDATITIPARILEGGWNFLFFSKEAKETIEYVSVAAPVVIYQLIDVYFFIIGFYFGSGGSKK